MTAAASTAAVMPATMARAIGRHWAAVVTSCRRLGLHGHASALHETTARVPGDYRPMHARLVLVRDVAQGLVDVGTYRGAEWLEDAEALLDATEATLAAIEVRS